MVFSRAFRAIRSQPEWGLPFLFFAVLAVHGSLFGLTDDEAYYWVLAQKPSLGFAYHPPAVVWLIAASEKLFGSLFGTHSVFLVRLPGLACVAAMLAISLRWLEECGVRRERLWSAGGVLISFAGMFALSWMMVPDLPLFLGFTLTFVSVWRICFSEKAPYSIAALGTALLFLSKYSAVLSLGSAGVAVLFWAPPSRRWKALAALALGGALGTAPALIWNARHEWVSILYQIRGRHEGAALSWVRYGRFWGAQVIAAGPVAIVFAFWICYRALRDGIGESGSSETKMSRYLAGWIVPAALVFCLQPLWSDFKPHWAFIVWWPAFLGLAWFSLREGNQLWKRGAVFQRATGYLVGAIVLIACQFPIATAILKYKNANADPRLDVSNDLYGWRDLSEFMKQHLSPEDLALPVVGSRYQTASQAGFALEEGARFSMLPSDIGSRDEWPALGVTEGDGPGWPRLKSPVLFVRDNRYDALPEFPGAKCAPRGRLEKTRWNYPAKWIEVWRCEPDGARP